jgi:hypothetical protein
MFVSDQVMVPLGFTSVQARLANLVRSGTLRGSSDRAYHDGIAQTLRVGPSAAVSHLVRAEFRDLVARGDSSVLTLRWEATGPASALFPVLDADITITPHGQDQTLLRLDGSYRPPLGSLGAGLNRAVLHRAATATIRAFITSISEALAHPAAGHETAPERPERAWLPDPEAP